MRSEWDAHDHPKRPRWWQQWPTLVYMAGFGANVGAGGPVGLIVAGFILTLAVGGAYFGQTSAYYRGSTDGMEWSRRLRNGEFDDELRERGRRGSPF